MIEYKVKVYENRTEWFLNGQLHREDGPAIEYAKGDKSWFLNGERHREDGPAIDYANGDKSWYLNGKLHREDGPALEWADGYKYWYLNGEKLTEEEFLNRQSHSITIDGKKVSLSNESFNELTKFFKGDKQ